MSGEITALRVSFEAIFAFETMPSDETRGVWELRRKGVLNPILSSTKITVLDY